VEFQTVLQQVEKGMLEYDIHSQNLQSQQLIIIFVLIIVEIQSGN
jgi:hypothetical protein